MTAIESIIDRVLSPVLVLAVVVVAGVTVADYVDRHAPATVVASSVPSPAREPVTDAAYVASVNSDVFHRATCASAARILSANRVGYASREDVPDWRRACRRCKP